MARPAADLSGGHTPGPWTVSEKFGDHLWVERHDFLRGEPETIVLVATKRDERIERGDETVWRKHPLPHARANARLIAAAPDMLAALSEVSDTLDRFVDVVDGTEGDGPQPNWAMRLKAIVDEALAKAEG